MLDASILANRITTSLEEKLKTGRGFRHSLAIVNALSPIAPARFVVLFLLGILLASAGAGAEGPAGPATVKGILGEAQFSRGGGSFTPLRPGTAIQPGDLIQTASRSAVDLSLGKIAGTVRLTESTTLVLEKLTAGDGTAGANFEVLLSLRGGEVLGLAKPVPHGSRFEIKVAHGLAQVLEGRFRVDSAARVVVVQGKVLFAYIPTRGEPAAHTLAAPPAVYFAPDAGVRPAPKDLQREVVNQMRSKLPRR
jgi:hypothetical protein